MMHSPLQNLMMVGQTTLYSVFTNQYFISAKGLHASPVGPFVLSEYIVQEIIFSN